MNNNLCKYFKSNLNNLSFKDYYENLINLSKQLKCIIIEIILLKNLKITIKKI